jgi:hypothetical protein
VINQNRFSPAPMNAQFARRNPSAGCKASVWMDRFGPVAKNAAANAF